MCLLKHEACSGTGPKLVRHHCVHLILPKWVITPHALELKTLLSDFCLGGRADFGGCQRQKVPMVIRGVLFLRVRKPPSSLRIFGSGGYGTSQKLRRYDRADANPRSSVRTVSAAMDDLLAGPQIDDRTGPCWPRAGQG